MADGEMAGTGIAGLDQIMNGGLAKGHLYLIDGEPGSGKTTVALSFILEGARRGETGLYITLSETEAELRLSARSHGWEIGPLVTVRELVPPEALLAAGPAQSLLYPSDFELGETTRMIFELFEEIRPQRVVLDSLSEIRLLAQNSLRYRRQIMAMKQYFARSDATVLLLDDLVTERGDRTVHSLVHGVVNLAQITPEYGPERRRARVLKYRGNAYAGGYHDMRIRTGAVEVYPRLVAQHHTRDFDREATSSGIPEFDRLLAGGIERGSSTLVLGPSGAGKTLVGLQFLLAAIGRGERAAMLSFDEEFGLLVRRLLLLGIDLEAEMKRGLLRIDHLDTAEITPGEFAQLVRRRVADWGAQAVLIDSLNGYQASMPDEAAQLAHMHELLQYLNRQGVTTFLTIAQHGLVGDMKSPVDITYLADTVILLRYFEAMGRMRRALSVIKKRMGGHEHTIREYRITEAGLVLGEPLEEFQGVLRGVPVFVGQDLTRLMGG
ncbi:ATPase domain-containing protein [Amaricoccus solimangrovi]|uniref:non-specific serine/threonine protein kinase n=1 Tax=Amaricoccus solimangrovi TaxID=2589815 RepID=A0A501WXP1_9RHOB|nr:ATPase domain-containing protein [Amaricoccus solimangrovi]TPE52944.1 circadian clock protein KaiC [Amaricoccus solimangrovi]